LGERAKKREMKIFLKLHKITERQELTAPGTRKLE
jgi:hypothetical protein